MATKSHSSPHAFAHWISDVVSVERHIDSVLVRQTEMNAAPPIILYLHNAVHESRARAEVFRKNYVTPSTLSVLQPGLDLQANTTELNDQMRDETLSKALRSDFIACNLAAVSYSMLHTTAIALENEHVAAFAAEGLRTYARLISEIGTALPGAVIEDLVESDSGLPIDVNAAAIASSQQQGLWRQLS